MSQIKRYFKLKKNKKKRETSVKMHFEKAHSHFVV